MSIRMTKEIYNQIEETFIHKDLFNKSCLKMSEYLNSIGKSELAIGICHRAVLHDNSKLDDNELGAFSKLDNRKAALRDPNVGFDDDTRHVIEVHWNKNRHHPEYFPNIEDMTEIDILEMCCDWHARSVQYGTDLLEFAQIRQDNRFRFKEEQYKKIMEYCKILSS